MLLIPRTNKKPRRPRLNLRVCKKKPLHAWLFSSAGDVHNYGTSSERQVKKGSPIFNHGIQGTSWDFRDSTSNYFSTGDMGGQPPNVYAVEAYFYIADKGSNQGICTFADTEALNNDVDRSLWYYGNGKDIRFWTFPSPLETVSVDVHDKPGWHHAIASCDGSTMFIAADGNLSSNNSVASGGYSGFSDQLFVVGKGKSTGAVLSLDGKVAYVIIHNRFISQAEASFLTRPGNEFIAFEPEHYFAPVQIPSTTVTPTVVGLSAAAQAPTLVAGGQPQTVTPDAVGLTASAQAPTLVLGAMTVVPDAIGLSVSATIDAMTTSSLVVYSRVQRRYVQSVYRQDHVRSIQGRIFKIFKAIPIAPTTVTPTTISLTTHIQQPMVFGPASTIGQDVIVLKDENTSILMVDGKTTLLIDR